jgi:hypothetical protein
LTTKLTRHTAASFQSLHTVIRAQCVNSNDLSSRAKYRASTIRSRGTLCFSLIETQPPHAA